MVIVATAAVDGAGGPELWTYDLHSDIWTLYRTGSNPGYRLSSWAAHDPISGHTILIGGDFFDDDRRFLGDLDDTWIYSHNSP